MSAGRTTAADFEHTAAAVCERLARNQRVRRNLPGEGRIRIDRQLPFLCVYRSPPNRNDAGTQELVTTEAAYLFASGDPLFHEGLANLCRRISDTVQEHFGTFLLVEIWAEEDSAGAAAGLRPPAFQIVASEPVSLRSPIVALETALSGIVVHGQAADVMVKSCACVTAPGLPPLMQSGSGQESGGCLVLGLAVRPVYRDAATGGLFPMILQQLRRELAVAIRKAVFAFTGDQSETSGGCFESLGPTSTVQAAGLVDRQLCEVASSFDFLLQVTPVNSDDAWNEFRDSGYTREPAFYYRPLPYHPNLLKRQLFDIPIERIEDATLAHLCWEKQEELDRQLSALRDLGTSHFCYESLQLYGGADAWLVALAEDILRRVPPAPGNEAEEEYVTPGDVVNRARQEIDYYRRKIPDFNTTVMLRNDIASGIMVAQDRLLVSDTLRMPRSRLEPLMHHEVGTHLLTYFNGRRQPFGQMHVGLAGYEPLQEGLAVLAEYLVGGLTASRLRTLAGRALAVRSMLDGATFIETFHHLQDNRGFSSRAAFTTTLRVFRGGGLTKDAVYLRGLHDLLEYLGEGHDIEPLYVGKIGLHHVPFIQEMRRRGLLLSPGALPRFWENPDLRQRLEACRKLTIRQLK